MIKRIEEMIKKAVQDIFDMNYCPHGSECRFCREDMSSNQALYDMDWYNDGGEDYNAEKES